MGKLKEFPNYGFLNIRGKIHGISQLQEKYRKTQTI